MNFGENFRKIRNSCGLSQKDVAEKLKICQSNISDWENDISRPNYEKLIELAKIYDVSLYEILDLKEPF